MVNHINSDKGSHRKYYERAKCQDRTSNILSTITIIKTTPSHLTHNPWLFQIPIPIIVSSKCVSKKSMCHNIKLPGAIGPKKAIITYDNVLFYTKIATSCISITSNVCGSPCECVSASIML